MLIAWIGFPSTFAASPLTEWFTDLSQQILDQSITPSQKLEELKSIFTSCANKHEKAEIKSACKEWLAESYEKIKEATPQQIYVEIGSEDVEVKKIWEVELLVKTQLGEQLQKFMQYEVYIPKYKFIYQFVLNLGEEKKLKDWSWSESGSIAIPYSWIKKLQPKTLFRLYGTPTLHSKSSLVEIWKMYKKVFKEVYALKDIEAFYKEMS